MEIMNYIDNANKEQLEALGVLGQWMQEMGGKHCHCTVECYKECELYRQLQNAFGRVGERLQE
ncbi:MAG: hypothetical protein ACLFUV_02000 [Methanomassiliicoccales archaeon]